MIHCNIWQKEFCGYDHYKGLKEVESESIRWISWNPNSDTPLLWWASWGKQMCLRQRKRESKGSWATKEMMELVGTQINLSYNFQNGVGGPESRKADSFSKPKKKFKKIQISFLATTHLLPRRKITPQTHYRLLTSTTTGQHLSCWCHTFFDLLNNLRKTVWSLQVWPP